MKTLFTAEAISKGGRSGTIQTPDRLLNVTLGNPLQQGIEKRGPNPELLFAGAYSACFHGALTNAAKKLGTPVEDSTVRALVSLLEDDQGGYRLAVELHAQLRGIDHTQAQHLMNEAHKTCPYSKALRGDTSVTLVAD
jgi:osmotically inducible protein OsmC